MRSQLAPWCGRFPGDRFMPAGVAAKFSGNYLLVKNNSDHSQEMYVVYEVDTALLYRGGRLPHPKGGIRDFPANGLFARE